MGVAVGFVGYHGILWASMGFARNIMEKLGFFGFSLADLKFNRNESNSLQSDVKVG
jgi:hypothetical protein